MQAVVSLFDEQHQQRIAQLWADLAAGFGVRGVYITPFPHFSYHVAKKYHDNELAAVLQDFASRHPAFKIRAGGIGIFPAASPVLYIPVVRSLELSQLHAALWPALGKVSDKVVEHYSPAEWVPHITIGQTDINSDNLGPIVAWLNQQQLSWEISVTSIGTIYAKGTNQFLGPQYPFSSHLCPHG